MSPKTRATKRNSLITHYSLFIPVCAVVLGVVGGLPVQAQENGNAPQKLNPYTGNAQAIAEGQELYKQLNCYGCHGMRGGGGMGPNLTDETWQTGDGSDASLLAQIREGRGKMPSFKDAIDDDQAWKIIAFVRSLYKGDPEMVKW